MPFQQVRQNQPIYILHKSNEPKLEIGQVVSVSQPKAQFPNNQLFNSFLDVDITVKIGENMQTFQKLPALSEIADFGSNANIVISCSRESMSNEVNNLKQRSEEILNSIDSHKKIIESCNQILLNINPEFAERKRLIEDNEYLRKKIEELEQRITNEKA